MGFADFRVNTPGSLFVSIEGLLDGPALLVKVGRRTRKAHRPRCGGSWLENQQLELTQVQIAVVRTAGSFLWQGFVHEYLDLHGGNARQWGRGRDGISVALRPSSTGQQRTIRLALQCRAAHRDERLRFDDFP